MNKTFISRCWLTKDYVLVLKTPKKINFNEDNLLHHTKEASYLFEGDTCPSYHVNGREIEEEIFKNCQTIEGARQEFFKTNNEDLKACIITIVKENEGNKGLMKMLNAFLVDKKKVKHSSGHVEVVKLYKTKEKYDFLQDHHGNMGQPYCWSEMECPSTGSIYLIDNSAAFDDAIEAMKFLRPSFIPMDLKYNHRDFAN